MFCKTQFIHRSLVATHSFDPGRINFYGCYNDTIELRSNDKKKTLVCLLHVKVQYIHTSDYFTCPTCSKLADHKPIVILGNINTFTPKKSMSNLSVAFSCGKFTEKTDMKKDGQFGHHFMADPSLFTKKVMTLQVYKKNSVIGSCTVPCIDIEEGNWCDWQLKVIL